MFCIINAFFTQEVGISPPPVWFQYIEIVEKQVGALMDHGAKPHNLPINKPNKPRSPVFRIELPAAHFLGILPVGEEWPHEGVKITLMAVICTDF